MKSLQWYLHKIERNEPISVNTFFKQWNASGLTQQHVNSVFSINGSLVSVKDQKAFDELKSIYCVDGGRESRSTAAVGGHSHKVRVDGSLVVIRSLLNPHPVAVMISPEGAFYSRELHKKALVVENLQNFLEMENTFAFCKSITSNFTDYIELIWSEGNAINNALHSEFMSSFEETWWLMDADLGGLKIMENALKYLPPQSFNLLVPPDIENRLKQHGKLITEEKRNEIARIGKRCPSLRPMAEPIFRLYRSLEQETYLLSSRGNNDEL